MNVSFKFSFEAFTAPWMIMNIIHTIRWNQNKAKQSGLSKGLVLLVTDFTKSKNISKKSGWIARGSSLE